jgi:hypothetical protein
MTLLKKKICLFKGTLSRYFFTPVFFIKHLLLVPLDTPGNDFKFFQIFQELFEFVIDSHVYSSPGVSTPQCIHHRGRELRLVSVFITGELIWTLGSHFTDFKEHTTIFNRIPGELLRMCEPAR